MLTDNVFACFLLVGFLAHVWRSLVSFSITNTFAGTYLGWAITADNLVDEHAVNDLALTVYAKTRGIVGTAARFSPCAEVHALFVKLVKVSLEEIGRLGFLGGPT